MVEKIIAILPQKSDSDLRKMVSNAERLIASGADGQRKNAQRVLEAIEVELSRRNQAMVAMPLPQRLHQAFCKSPPSDSERVVIRALLDNPGSTSAHLTKVCGYAGNSAWHLRFGELCKRRQADLWPAPASEQRDGSFFSGILAEFDTKAATFTM
ncbi:MAG: hypothetical protein KDA73_02450 [Rhodobacteraceae bacterium]|nr:hypothetical protein [Paracoccaceae bacterium]